MIAARPVSCPRALSEAPTARARARRGGPPPRSGTQYVDGIEIVRRNRNFRLVRADPAFARPKSRDRPALRDVFQIVPIVEFIGVRAREIEHCKQQSIGHWQSPQNPLLALYMRFAPKAPIKEHRTVRVRAVRITFGDRHQHPDRPHPVGLQSLAWAGPEDLSPADWLAAASKTPAHCQEAAMHSAATVID